MAQAVCYIVFETVPEWQAAWDVWIFRILQKNMFCNELTIFSPPPLVLSFVLVALQVLSISVVTRIFYIAKYHHAYILAIVGRY